MRRTSCIVLVACWAQPLRAQDGVVWTSEFDFPAAFSDDVPNALATDRSGSVYVSGAVRTSATSSEFDPLTIKLDDAGNVQWFHCYDNSPQSSFAHALAIDAFDCVYVATSGRLPGQNSVSVLKYDPTGGLIWASSPSLVPTPLGAAIDARQMLLDPAGNIYVAGWMEVPTSSGSERDMLLMSLTSSGALRFALGIDGESDGDDRASCISLDTDGGVVLLGPADATSQSSGLGIVKVAGNGALSWLETGPGLQGELLSPVGVGANQFGGIYFAWNRWSDSGALVETRMSSADSATGTFFLDFDLPIQDTPLVDLHVLRGNQVALAGTRARAGGASMFVTVARAPRSGNFWARSWSAGPGTSCVARRVFVDPNGDVIVTGEVTYAPSGWEDIDLAIVRYSPQGQERWHTLVDAGPQHSLHLQGAGLHEHGGVSLAASKLSTPVGGTPSPANYFVARTLSQSYAFCFGDGSIAACPCNNTSSVGMQAGCRNSTGVAAVLADAGMASITFDSLSLTARETTPGTTCMFIQSLVNASPKAFGDGLRCTGGGMLRLYSPQASGGVSSVPGPSEPSITQRCAELGQPIAPASTRIYQVFYRDADASYCPPPHGSAWNTSGALRVRWSL
jgi:hypothetical protein